MNRRGFMKSMAVAVVAPTVLKGAVFPAVATAKGVTIEQAMELAMLPLKDASKIEWFSMSVADYYRLEGLMMSEKKLIRLRDVSLKITELTGVHRSRATIYLWVNHGCRTLDGRRVYLKTVTRMGQLFTDEDKIKEFIEGVG